ncbi:10230_t:CDS:10 [Ambispora leptoticha]|uniref:10230_t:CDS:1 n=1 Tax=Ambispora leptoticha TaxID=144679 RepID=A0A9N8Z3H4_9GLOM|nr:10230_t:CDS:10 [Ambispora leptoticha]
MTTASTRQTRSRRDQAAFSFLSNISLGTETSSNTTTTNSSTFEPTHRRVTTVPGQFQPEEFVKNHDTLDKLHASSQNDNTHSGKENKIDNAKRPTLSIDIPGKPGKHTDFSTPFSASKEKSSYPGNSTIDLRNNSNNHDFEISRRRSNSLRDDIAVAHFLSSISLDPIGNSNVRDNSQNKNNSTYPINTGKVSEQEHHIFIDDETDHFLSPVNSVLGTIDELLEDNNRSMMLKHNKRQNSVSSLQNHANTNSTTATTTPISPAALTFTNENTLMPQVIRRESLSSSFGSGKSLHSGEYVEENHLPTVLKQPSFVMSGSPDTSTFGGILSMFGFKDDKHKHPRIRRDTLKQNSTNNISVKKSEDESYAELLKPSNSLSPGIKTSDYDPYFLDVPELKMGKKPGRTLPNFVNSLLQQKRTRESDLKRELNAKFRQAHPNLDPSLTLTQIRAIKEKLLIAARHEDLDLELSTVAKSYVYFEKLVLKKLVAKHNRRLTAVNEPKETSYTNILESLHKHLDVSEKEIKEHEFSVFASLQFELYVPRNEFMPHFHRIFETLNDSVKSQNRSAPSKQRQITPPNSNVLFNNNNYTPLQQRSLGEQFANLFRRQTTVSAMTTTSSSFSKKTSTDTECTLCEKKSTVDGSIGVLCSYAMIEFDGVVGLVMLLIRNVVIL